MNLDLWAKKWNIPTEAVVDLRRLMGINNPDIQAIEGESESAVQTRVRLEASEHGARLWRNNVGAGKLENGSFVRWGLCNDSKKMNEFIKSSDLIGIQPVEITIDHIGQTIGQFVAREVKAADWVWRGTPREYAQLRFLELVMSMGGDAAFAIGEGTF